MKSWDDETTVLYERVTSRLKADLHRGEGNQRERTEEEAANEQAETRELERRLELRMEKLARENPQEGLARLKSVLAALKPDPS
jgi:hypothetical protein